MSFVENEKNSDRKKKKTKSIDMTLLVSLLITYYKFIFLFILDFYDNFKIFLNAQNFKLVILWNIKLVSGSISDQIWYNLWVTHFLYTLIWNDNIYDIFNKFILV